jgi:hypothetical protein
MKVKGVSVQSIIIGSVITGVIAGAGLAAMWPSVEKSKINAERVTINEVSNALMGAMEERMSAVTYVDASVLTQMKSRLSALPAFFNYRIAVENDAAGNAAVYLLSDVSNPKSNTASVQRLKDVVKALDVQFDGTSAVATTGKFRYDTTCDGTAGCFYAVHLADLGINSSTFGSGTPIPPNVTTDALVTTNLAVQVSHGKLN